MKDISTLVVRVTIVTVITLKGSVAWNVLNTNDSAQQII